MRLSPGAGIGIVGGGQLGRMTALAAARLGYRCHILTSEADSPAAQVTDRVTVAAYDDPRALERFARTVDVATIEFENLPVAPLAELAERVPMHPAPAVLAICQDRLREKAFLAQIGVATAPWRAVQDAQGLAAALAELNGPVVLKTARFGYDGKGQLGLGPGDDPAAAWARFGGGPAVAEARIDFGREISVITARGQDGSEAGFPPVENRHRDGVLAQTIAPAPISATLAEAARTLAARIARELGVVGLLAVEMFVTRDGSLLGQRAGAAAAQFRPLDDRCLRDQPVRAAGARGLRAAAARPRALCRRGHGQSPGPGDRRLARAPGRTGRTPASLRQARNPRRAQARPRHPAHPPHLWLTRPQLVPSGRSGPGPDKARALARAVVGNQVLWKGVPIFSAPPSARPPLRR